MSDRQTSFDQSMRALSALSDETTRRFMCDVRQIVEKVVADIGTPEHQRATTIDILCSNALYVLGKTFIELSESEYKTMLKNESGSMH